MYRVEKWKEVYAPNRAALRAMLAAERFEISQLFAKPNAVCGWNKHPFERSHWIISGALRITIEKVGAFVLQAGDRDFIPAETHYAIEAVGDEPVLYFVGIKIEAEEKKKRGRISSVKEK